jgi:hypothetical protein
MKPLKSLQELQILHDGIIRDMAVNDGKTCVKVHWEPAAYHPGPGLYWTGSRTK